MHIKTSVWLHLSNYNNGTYGLESLNHNVMRNVSSYVRAKNRNQCTLAELSLSTRRLQLLLSM